MIMGDGKKMFKSIVKFSDECLTKGGVAVINFGFRKVYAITDPEDCLTMANACINKHYFYDFGKCFLGNGLFTADAETWKVNRKLINPALNQQIIDSYIDIFNSQAQLLVQHFATEQGKPFDHENYLRISNLETIISTSFGITGQEYGDFLEQYMSRFKKIVKSINERIQKFWLHNDFIYNMTHEKKMLEVELKHIFALSKSIIQRNKLEKRRAIKPAKTDKFKTFINLILDLAADTGCFTDEQIQEETDTMIVGGFDSNATIMSLTLTTLGSHPDVQEKVYNEIMDILGNSDRNLEKDDLSKLVYTEAVLKEILRLHPILPVVPRYIEKDVQLKNFTIKANSECFILVYGLHRHAIWGPDADQFRPERWLEKETLPDSKYFGAFGLGRRACIGKTYALTSIKITLAHIIRKYIISSDISKMVMQMQLSIRSDSGYYITIRKRTPEDE